MWLSPSQPTKVSAFSSPAAGSELERLFAFVSQGMMDGLGARRPAFFVEGELPKRARAVVGHEKGGVAKLCIEHNGTRCCGQWKRLCLGMIVRGVRH